MKLTPTERAHIAAQLKAAFPRWVMTTFSTVITVEDLDQLVAALPDGDEGNMLPALSAWATRLALRQRRPLRPVNELLEELYAAHVNRCDCAGCREIPYFGMGNCLSTYALELAKGRLAAAAAHAQGARGLWGPGPTGES